MAKEKDKSTVFVRSVPFSVNEKGLEEFFSDIGPIKQCFLVKPKGQEQHRGFGFVHYALPEDAERAARELDGRALEGRKLQVELADKRAPMEERKRKRQGQADAAADSVVAADSGAAAAVSDGPPAQKRQKPPRKPQPQQQEQEPAQEKEKVQEQKVQEQKVQEREQAVKVARADSAVKAAVARPRRPTQQSEAEKQANAAKHRLVRAVAIGRLTPQATPAAISLARQLGKVEEVLHPAPQELVVKFKLQADGCSGDVVVVVYSTVQEAMDAITKLHGKTISPAEAARATMGKKALKGRKKGAAAGGPEGEGQAGGEGEAAAPVTLWCRQVSGEGAHVKKWRVIIRNLAFKATEASLRAAIQPSAGFVWDLKLPRGPDGRSKGFAFASFTCQAHAQKAIATCNGKEVGGRMIVVDWAVEKDKFEAAQKEVPKQQEGKGKGKASKGAQEDEEGEEGEEDEGRDGEEGEEGTADGVAEEEEEEDEEAKTKREHDMLHSVLNDLIEQEGEDEDEEEEEEPAQKKGPKDKGVDAAGKEGKDAKQRQKDGAQASAEGSKHKGKEAGEPVVLNRGPDYLRKTVFVRGLALDVTSIELQARLETFGPVHMCRVVMDRMSGKPKGTAFVEYKSAADAQKAAAACDRGRKGVGPGISLGGQPIEVDLALNPDDIRALASGKTSKGGAPEKKDKRNLYLAQEGLVPEGSAAWEALSDADKGKRKRAADEMRQKLQSPNFMLSPTRLNLRNLPYDVNEAQLRKLVIAAVKERATMANPRILNVKVLKESEKLGPDGKPRSKGMGFVEFSEHEHAVAALRQLNNNPKTFGANRRPIVEFAVENVRVLKKLEAIRAQKEQKKTEGKGKQQAAGKGQETGEGEAVGLGDAEGSDGGDEEGEADGEVMDEAGEELEEKQDRKGGKGKRGEQGEAKHGKGKRGRDGDDVEAANGAQRPGKKAKPSGPKATQGQGDDGGNQPALSKRQQKRAKLVQKIALKKQKKEAAATAQQQSGQQGRDTGAQGRGRPGPDGKADAAGTSGKPAQPQQQQKQQQRQQQQGPGGQAQARGGAGKGPRQKAEAKPARPDLKQQAQAAREHAEAKVHKHKSDMDAAVDRLAAAGMSNGGGDDAERGPRRRAKPETDRLDKLVEQYRAKFTGTSEKAADQKKVAVGGELRRWFE